MSDLLLLGQSVATPSLIQYRVDGDDCGLNCSAPLCGAACRGTRSAAARSAALQCDLCDFCGRCDAKHWTRVKYATKEQPKQFFVCNGVFATRWQRVAQLGTCRQKVLDRSKA